MTDPTASTASATTSANAAPGWYPDGSGGQRWWDGRAWTDHVAPATAGVNAAPLERPRLADDLKVDGAWVWVLAIVPMLLGAATLLFFDMGAYMRYVMVGDMTGAFASMALYTVASFVLGWGGLALQVVAAFRDYKALTALGVVRPFHWAFSFLGAIVYLIGRHVILRKVTKTSGAPLWVHIAVYVLVIILIFVWMFVSMAALFSQFPYYSNVY